jgi:hypothetical protein
VIGSFLWLLTLTCAICLYVFHTCICMSHVLAHLVMNFPFFYWYKSEMDTTGIISMHFAVLVTVIFLVNLSRNVFCAS